MSVFGVKAELSRSALGQISLVQVQHIYIMFVFRHHLLKSFGSWHTALRDLLGALDVVKEFMGIQWVAASEPWGVLVQLLLICGMLVC